MGVLGLIAIGLAACGSDSEQNYTAECQNGETRTIACGSNDENTQQQVCVAYRWEDQGPCQDIAECEEGQTRRVACGPRDAGLIDERCNRRQHWVPKDDARAAYCEDHDDVALCLCVLPDTCTGEHTDVQPCGYNDRGSTKRVCSEGHWSEFDACNDPDECEDDVVQLRECFGESGEFGTLVQQRTCTHGYWSSYGPCEDPAECYEGDVEWFGCGRDGRGIVQKQCEGGWWSDIDEGTCYQTADGILSGAQSASLYFDDSAYLSAWGDNRRGALGVREGDPGWGATHLTTPTEVGVPAPAALDVDWVPVVAWRFGAARSHQCSIDASRTLWCWGRNDAGQLGLPADDEIVHPPTQINLPDGEDATFVAVAEQATCAVGDETRLYCWGDNAYGKLGVEDLEQTHIPQLVEDNLGGYKIAGLWMSGAHGCMLDALGTQTLYCWGDNRHGQTHESEAEAIVPYANPPSGMTSIGFFIPPDIPSDGANFSSVVDFQDFVMTPDNLFYVTKVLVSITFLDEDEPLTTSTRIQVNGVGSNLNGQLGEAYSDHESQGVPVLDVVGSSRHGEPMLAFYAGGDTVCAYAKSYDDPEPRFLCQGDNSNGQIGDSDTLFFDSFQDLTDDVDPDREGVKSAIVGEDFLCVLLDKTQRIRCRGNNEHGQLGDGTTTSRDWSGYVLHL